MSTTSSALCPELATPPTFVITIENVDSLRLSTYNRTVGTTVQITCLTRPEFRLVGTPNLTCLGNGSWDDAIPICEPAFDTTTTTTAGDGTGADSDITMVPFIVLSSILGLIFLAFVVVMLFVLIYWRKAGGCWRTRKDPEAVRALSVQEAESVFTERRRAAYCPSDCSDNLDSVSTRLPHVPRHPHVRPNPADNLAYSNGRRYMSSHDLAGTNSIASYDMESMPVSSRGQYFGNVVSQERQPPDFKTRVGTRQHYRTWQELFYSPDR